METLNKSVDESLGKLQNQIDGTKKEMKTLYNDIIKDKNDIKTDIENIFKSVESLKNVQTQFEENINEIKKDWTRDVEMVQSVMETQNKSVDESLGKLQHQIDGTKEHVENNMTEIMEKVKEVAVQMKTLESGMTKTNARVEGVDSQLHVFYKELKDNSK